MEPICIVKSGWWIRYIAAVDGSVDYDPPEEYRQRLKEIKDSRGNCITIFEARGINWSRIHSWTVQCLCIIRLYIPELKELEIYVYSTRSSRKFECRFSSYVMASGSAESGSIKQGKEVQ